MAFKDWFRHQTESAFKDFFRYPPEDGRPGSPYIECPRCHIRSYNSGDIQHKFCIRCGWHDDFGTDMDPLVRESL